MPSALPAPVQRLIDELGRLPGIGPKTAARLAFHLLRVPPQQARDLATALRDLVDGVLYCPRCHNIADSSPCALCRDPNREASQVCVVEEPLDVAALERAGEYRGLYHVLHGALSPLHGVGPEDLRIRELLERLKVEPVQELIVATNPSLEGDATAMYLERAVHAQAPGLRMTRLARGLPVGGDIEYADEITLARAFEGRSELRGY